MADSIGRETATPEPLIKCRRLRCLRCERYMMTYHDQVLEGGKGNEAKCSICNQHVGMGNCPFKGFTLVERHQKR